MDNSFAVSYSWIKTSSDKKYSPITQVYGMCFNAKEELLICRKNSESPWQLPGGKPEKNESLEETLQREVQEEANVIIHHIQLLGYNRVTYPRNPNTLEGEVFYQARMICDIKKVVDQTIDPDTECIWERLFVSLDEIDTYLHWGDSGKHMINDAVELRNLMKK